jgi:hypothetical protein
VAKLMLGLPAQGMLPVSYLIANASVTKLISGSTGIKLSTLNEHSHFEGMDPKFLTYR